MSENDDTACRVIYFCEQVFNNHIQFLSEYPRKLGDHDSLQQPPLLHAGGKAYCTAHIQVNFAASKCSFCCSSTPSLIFLEVIYYFLSSH